jgi:FkbM family methyltransferase
MWGLLNETSARAARRKEEARVKAAIKYAMRRLGLNIRRYPVAVDPASTETQLLPHWVRRLQTTGPVQVIFDVGANRGQTSAVMRAAFPLSTIYSFEPSPTAFTKLQARVAGDPRIRVFQQAVGEHDGFTILHENASDVTNSLLPNSSRLFQFAPADLCAPTKETSVPITRLDTFCAKEPIQRIDVLKIDAQGYERYILAGAGCMLTPAVIRGLVIEVLFVDLYDNQSWCGELLEVLRARGYRLFAMSNVGYDVTNGWKWADAMFLGEAGYDTPLSTEAAAFIRQQVDSDH